MVVTSWRIYSAGMQSINIVAKISVVIPNKTVILQIYVKEFTTKKPNFSKTETY